MEESKITGKITSQEEYNEDRALKVIDLVTHLNEKAVKENNQRLIHFLREENCSYPKEGEIQILPEDTLYLTRIFEGESVEELDEKNLENIEKVLEFLLDNDLVSQYAHISRMDLTKPRNSKKERILGLIFISPSESLKQRAVDLDTSVQMALDLLLLSNSIEIEVTGEGQLPVRTY